MRRERLGRHCQLPDELPRDQRAHPVRGALRFGRRRADRLQQLERATSGGSDVASAHAASPLTRLPRLPRWRRRLLRALLAAAVALIALAASGAGYLLSLPGVGDAEQRVQVLLAEHHSHASGLPPPAKLAAAVVAVEDEHFYANFLIDIARRRRPRCDSQQSHAERRPRRQHDHPAARHAALRPRLGTSQARCRRSGSA